MTRHQLSMQRERETEREGAKFDKLDITKSSAANIAVFLTNLKYCTINHFFYQKLHIISFFFSAIFHFKILAALIKRAQSLANVCMRVCVYDCNLE